MPRPIAAEDLWNLKRVGQPQHIPGTTRSVVPVGTDNDDNEAHSVLHVVDRDGTTRQLTSSERHASAPAPSPAGTQIAILGRNWIENRDNALHWWGEVLGSLERWLG